jgi:hypothetical protein
MFLPLKGNSATEAEESSTMSKSNVLSGLNMGPTGMLANTFNISNIYFSPFVCVRWCECVMGGVIRMKK